MVQTRTMDAMRDTPRPTETHESEPLWAVAERYARNNRSAEALSVATGRGLRECLAALAIERARLVPIAQ